MTGPRHISIGYLRHLSEIAPTEEDRWHFAAVADEVERLRAELSVFDPVLTIAEDEYLTASDGTVVYRGPGVLYERIEEN